MFNSDFDLISKFNRPKFYALCYIMKVDILNMTISQRDKDHKKEIDILNQTIDKLEKKLETYEKRLFEIASRPTTNNINQD